MLVSSSSLSVFSTRFSSSLTHGLCTFSKAMNFRGDEMSTFRFGTSVGPARIVGNAQEVREEDEGENTRSLRLNVNII